MGAYFEAEVVKVTSEDTPTSNGAECSDSAEAVNYYHVKFDE